MRIGYDITALYIARAGIYYYSVHLLQQLATIDGADEIVLVDYAPVRGNLPLPFDISTLLTDRVSLDVIDGVAHRKLIRWQRMDFFGGRFAAQTIDAMLERPWRWYIEATTRHKQRAVLDRLDVFHTSDVTQLTLDGTALVATVHDLSPILFPELHTQETCALFREKIEYLKRSSADLIAVSQHTKQDLITVLGFPEERIHVVYNGVDDRFRPVASRATVAAELDKYGVAAADYILFVGTLEPRKNLVRLLEAYAQVRQSEGTATPPLVLAGGAGWHYQEIYQTAERLNLGRHVVFTGFVHDDDLPALFSGALFFVYPSIYEGFGIPVLEAMACGAPVVTSTLPSIEAKWADNNCWTRCFTASSGMDFAAGAPSFWKRQPIR